MAVRGICVLLGVAVSDKGCLQSIRGGYCDVGNTSLDPKGADTGYHMGFVPVGHIQCSNESGCICRTLDSTFG